MDESAKSLIVIAGPTAVGKTMFSIELAKKYKSEIFSCDSRQVYKELSIGSGMPSSDRLSSIKHHYIGSRSIEEHYTAGNFERDFDNDLLMYFKNFNVGILTGGSGLNIKAAIEGLDEFPEVKPEIYAQLNHILENKGLSLLTDKLSKVDPKSYKNIDLKNSRRIIRALAVSMAEGKPYSSYLSEKQKINDYQCIKICLTMDRDNLCAKINKRVDNMIESGLMIEAKSLLNYKNHRALNTIGYKELFQYFEGKSSLSQSIELIKRNSRRYAKRQMTWFRNQEDYTLLPVDNKAAIYQHIKERLDERL